MVDQYSTTELHLSTCERENFLQQKRSCFEFSPQSSLQITREKLDPGNENLKLHLASQVCILHGSTLIDWPYFLSVNLLFFIRLQTDLSWRDHPHFCPFRTPLDHTLLNCAFCPRLHLSTLSVLLKSFFTICHLPDRKNLFFCRSPSSSVLR